MYTQLLCAFYQCLEVTYVKTIFGSSLIWAIDFLKHHYSELCYDISSGSLSPKIKDPSLRAYMIKTFMQHPDPILAKFIEQACVGDDWEGIFKKLWPNIKHLEATVTGSMTQYIPMLNYYSGGLPLVSIKYNSSECDFGYNLNPMCDPYHVSYTIMPDMAYYEFIALESSNLTSTNLNPLTVDLANVEVGKEYELVITTYNGLYRYRMGDVLTPTGFYNSTPQFKFIRRKNVLLAIDIANTTETELQNAIDTASSLLCPYDIKITDYTSSVDMTCSPGHYVIYVELMTISRARWPKSEVLEQCCLAIEGHLGGFYPSCRADKSVGPLEIRVVSNGTFEKLMDVSKKTSLSQFKVPRCVKDLPMLELLQSGIVSTHFSPSSPRTDR